MNGQNGAINVKRAKFSEAVKTLLTFLVRDTAIYCKINCESRRTVAVLPAVCAGLQVLPLLVRDWKTLQQRHDLVARISHQVEDSGTVHRVDAILLRYRQIAVCPLAVF